MISKTYTLLDGINASLMILNSNKFLILETKENTRYVSTPLFVLLEKKGKTLNLTCTSKDLDSVTEFNQFLTRFELGLKNINNTFKRKLILKGLGFRITVLANKMIEFKIGFSHLITLKIPQNIKAKSKKNFLYLESNDNVLIGNFIDKIVSLKTPDSYKGKGF
jgi:ribosomal protein L6P/L9E